MEDVKVVMSAQEAKEYAAFKAAQAKKQAEIRRKSDLEVYNTLVDETIAEVFPELTQVSNAIRTGKLRCIEQFRQAIAMKNELYKVKTDQRSHTFTNSAGDRRVILGYYTLDNYRDTVEEGISMVREAIEALGKDEESRALVKAVLRLLSRDQKGTLKASRVLQLQRLAEESGNERFQEGVRIIRESYQPQTSKQFIRAEYKTVDGEWKSLSLGMTEA